MFSLGRKNGNKFCKEFKNNTNLQLWGHFNFYESLKIIDYLKPKKAILTNLHTDLDYNFLKKNLQSNIIPAYDGMKLTI